MGFFTQEEDHICFAVKSKALEHEWVMEEGDGGGDEGGDGGGDGAVCC